MIKAFCISTLIFSILMLAKVIDIATSMIRERKKRYKSEAIYVALLAVVILGLMTSIIVIWRT